MDLAPFTGPLAWRRLYKDGIPWFSRRNINPTVLPEYSKPVTVLFPNCSVQEGPRLR